jgi:hypothetical protein
MFTVEVYATSEPLRPKRIVSFTKAFQTAAAFGVAGASVAFSITATVRHSLADGVKRVAELSDTMSVRLGDVSSRSRGGVHACVEVGSRNS